MKQPYLLSRESFGSLKKKESLSQRCPRRAWMGRQGQQAEAMPQSKDVFVMPLSPHTHKEATEGIKLLLRDA